MKIDRTWTFDSAEVASAFDSHVREQLPWYDLATGAVAHFARHYVGRGGVVYDVGASTGNIGNALRSILDERSAQLIAIERSAEMAALYRGPGKLVVADASAVDFEPFDFAVCFLTLMFVPPSQRATLWDRLRSACKVGGAVMLVDKCEAAAGYAGSVRSKMALAAKLENGAPPGEVLEKEFSLAGIQRPLRAGEIEGGLEVLRFGDFAGWIFETA